MTRLMALVLGMTLCGAALAGGGSGSGGSGAGGSGAGGAGSGGSGTGTPPAAGPAPSGDALRERLVGLWSPDSADECTDGDRVIFFRSGGLLVLQGRRAEREGIGTWTVEGSTLTMRISDRTNPEAQPDTVSFLVTRDFGTHLQGDLAQSERPRQEQLYRCPEN